MGRLHVSPSEGQTTKAAYFLSGSFRFSTVSVSLIDDPFYRLITVYITLIENLPTTPRDVCVCQPDATPSPFFSKFWLVHVANVQVDYPNKEIREEERTRVILAMSSCAVVDFAELVTGSSAEVL